MGDVREDMSRKRPAEEEAQAEISVGTPSDVSAKKLKIEPANGASNSTTVPAEPVGTVPPQETTPKVENAPPAVPAPQPPTSLSPAQPQSLTPAAPAVNPPAASASVVPEKPQNNTSSIAPPPQTGTSGDESHILPKTAASPASSAGVPENSSPPYKKTNQLVYLETNLFRALWRCKEAWPFQVPVDPVKLNLPDYFDIVKRPMDMGTIQKKMKGLQYQNAAECIADFKQMFTNCALYNAEGTDVRSMCKVLEDLFDKKMKQMPLEEYVIEPQVKSSKKKGKGGGSKSQSISPATAAAKKTSSNAPTPVAVPQASAAPVPVITPRARPQREIERSKSVELPKPIVVNVKKGKGLKGPLTDALKFCREVLKELMSTKHKDIAWPFYVPVDPVALNLPDYLTVIKKPMDLGTIKAKLDAKAYRKAHEFASDIRLVFSNCYRYNAADHDVTIMGRKLQEVFEMKFAMCPDEPEEESEASSSSEDDAEERAAEEARLKRQARMNELRKQIKGLQDELDQLIAADKAAKGPSSKSSSKKSSSGKAKEKTKKEKTKKVKRKRSNPVPKPVKPAKKIYDSSSDSEDESEAIAKPLSFEEKKNLSDSINVLPVEKLATVAQIIHSRIPELQNSDPGDVEIDIDSLDPGTLRELESFVKSLNKPPAPAPTSSSAGHKHKRGKKRSAEVEVKRRALPANSIHRNSPAPQIPSSLAEVTGLKSVASATPVPQHVAPQQHVQRPAPVSAGGPKPLSHIASSEGEAVDVVGNNSERKAAVSSSSSSDSDSTDSDGETDSQRTITAPSSVASSVTPVPLSSGPVPVVKPTPLATATNISSSMKVNCAPDATSAPKAMEAAAPKVLSSVSSVKEVKLHNVDSWSNLASMDKPMASTEGSKGSSPRGSIPASPSSGGDNDRFNQFKNKARIQQEREKTLREQEERANQERILAEEKRRKEQEELKRKKEEEEIRKKKEEEERKAKELEERLRMREEEKKRREEMANKADVTVSQQAGMMAHFERTMSSNASNFDDMFKD
eukprot:Nk52_evm11s2579 gene=Nk52_evmTU11s2579